MFKCKKQIKIQTKKQAFKKNLIKANLFWTKILEKNQVTF